MAAIIVISPLSFAQPPCLPFHAGQFFSRCLTLTGSAPSPIRCHYFIITDFRYQPFISRFSPLFHCRHFHASITPPNIAATTYAARLPSPSLPPLSPFRLDNYAAHISHHAILRRHFRSPLHLFSAGLSHYAAMPPPPICRHYYFHYAISPTAVTLTLPRHIDITLRPPIIFVNIIRQPPLPRRHCRHIRIIAIAAIASHIAPHAAIITIAAIAAAITPPLPIAITRHFVAASTFRCHIVSCRWMPAAAISCHFAAIIAASLPPPTCRHYAGFRCRCLPLFAATFSLIAAIIAASHADAFSRRITPYYFHVAALRCHYDAAAIGHIFHAAAADAASFADIFR